MIELVIPSLMPFPNWKKRTKNQVDAVVMIIHRDYEQDVVRHANVLEVQPVSVAIATTVTFGYKRRKEKEEQYLGRPLTMETVAVQRLSLLVPKDEKFE